MKASDRELLSLSSRICGRKWLERCGASNKTLASALAV